MGLIKSAAFSLIILIVAFILFASASDGLVGFRVDTDKETCIVGENVTATIIRYNHLPFATPESAITRASFSCTGRMTLSSIKMSLSCPEDMSTSNSHNCSRRRGCVTWH